MEYAGGKHEIVYKCDVDRMSIIEVHDILAKIGVTEWKTLQYCDPRYGLKKGLKSLESDADVLEMVNKLDKKRYIKIYVEPKDVCASQEDTFENALIPWEVEGERGGEMHVDFEVHSVSASLNDDISSHADSEKNSGEGEESSTKWAEYTSNSTDVEIGMKFASLHDIKKVVQENAMNDGHNIKFVKNEVRRLTAICVDGCKWRLHASRMQNEASFQIKTYHNVHTCARSMESRHASAKWVATKYVERFKSQPDWPIQSIIETVRRDYSINITAILSYRARKIARDMNDGCGNEQYKQLWSYAKEIRRTNPGSTFKICVDQVTKQSNPIFRRAYICFEACKQGILDGGRPVICLDGCHLKGQCPGHLLSAVGIDGNDGIYPIAVAVVESECSDSWQWFLEILLRDLRIINGSGWTFISDQQKGLVSTFTELVPQAEVRYCVRHMYANFKSKFRGKVYKDIMMSASRATTKYDFDKEMDKLRSFDTAVHTYLQTHDPRTWAKHLFSHVPKCDISLNNLSESFNALLLPARDKPILTMVETIRKIVMSRIAKKYKTMEEHEDELCPKVKKKLRSLMNASRNWSPLPAGAERFEVSHANERYIVDVRARTCSCYAWSLTGIPCMHAIPCILFMRQQVEDFVHPYYHRQTYMRIYSHFIHPINGPERWPHSSKKPIEPPAFRRRPGRPKKKRVRDVDEPQTRSELSKKNRQMTCSKCKGSGHNNRTCTSTDVSQTESTSGISRGRGRRARNGRGRGTNTFMGFSCTDDSGTRETESTDGNTRGRGRRTRGSGRGRGRNTVMTQGSSIAGGST